MDNVLFSRKVPPEMLYESVAMAEALGCMKYMAQEKLFGVVTRDAGNPHWCAGWSANSPGTNI